MKPRVTFRREIPHIPVGRDIAAALEGIEPSSLAILAGAGISFDAPAALPTASHFLQTMFDVCLPISVDRHVFRQQRKHALGAPYGGLRFEAVVDLVQRRFDPSLHLLALYGGGRPNANHVVLSELARRGALILTTNFDSLIETAGDTPLPARASADDFSLLADHDGAVEPAVWHLHGVVRDPETGVDRRQTIVASIRGCWSSRALFAVGAVKRQALARVLEARDLVVVGYSGSDDFDICPALEQLASARRVIWVDHAASTDVMDEIDLLTVDKLPDGFSWYRHSGRNVLAAMTSTGARTPDRVTVLRCDTRTALGAIAGTATAAASSGVSPPDPTPHFMRTWMETHLPTALDRSLLALLLFRAGNKRAETRKLLETAEQLLRSVEPRSSRSAVELLGIASEERSLIGGVGPVGPDAIAVDPENALVDADPVMKAAMLLSLARTMERTGRHAESVRLIEESLRIRREIGLDLDLDAVLHALAQSHFALGELDQAAVVADDARTEAERVGNPEGIALCNLLLARIWEQQGDRQHAFRHYEKAVAAARASGIEHLVALTSGEEGLFLWIEGARADHPRAAELLADAFRAHFVDEDVRELLIVASNLALCLESLDDLPRSLYADCIAFQCAQISGSSDAIDRSFSRAEIAAIRVGLPARNRGERPSEYVHRLIRALQERDVAM